MSLEVVHGYQIMIIGWIRSVRYKLRHPELVDSFEKYGVSGYGQITHTLV